MSFSHPVGRALFKSAVLLSVLGLSCAPLPTSEAIPTRPDPSVVLRAPAPTSALWGFQGAVYFASDESGVSNVYRSDPQTSADPERGPSALALTHSRETGYRPIAVLPELDSKGAADALLIEGSNGALQVFEKGERLRDVLPGGRRARFLRWADSGSSLWVAAEDQVPGRLDVIHVLGFGERGPRRTVWQNPGASLPLALGPGGRWLAVLAELGSGLELQLVDLQRPTEDPRTIHQLPAIDRSAQELTALAFQEPASAAFSPDGSSLWYVAPLGSPPGSDGALANEHRQVLWAHNLGEHRTRVAELRSGDVLGVAFDELGSRRLTAWRDRGRARLSLRDVGSEEDLLLKPALGERIVGASMARSGQELLFEHGGFVEPHGLAIWNQPTDSLRTVRSAVQLEPVLCEPLQPPREPSSREPGHRLEPTPLRYRLRLTPSTRPGPWVLWVADDDGLEGERFEPLARLLLEADVRILRVSRRLGATGVSLARRALVEMRLADPRRIGLVGWQRGAPTALATLAEAGQAFAVAAVFTPPRELPESSDRLTAIGTPLFVASLDTGAGLDSSYTQRTDPPESPPGRPRWKTAVEEARTSGRRMAHHALPAAPAHENRRELDAARLAASEFLLELLAAPAESPAAGTESFR